MVNRGASRGCFTCRKRRVKCDERKPWCRACLRLGIECAGYAKPRLKFKDETTRYRGNSPLTATRASKRKEQRVLENTIIQLPPNYPQDLAVPFFLTYVTDVGRSLESTRGFLEFVRPVLATQDHDSALNTAVTATAIKIWTMIGNHQTASSLPYQSLNKALKRLHKATEDPEERGRDATVLAALVLQMHDTLSAVSGQARAHGAHREGAMALLLKRENRFKDSKYYAHLISNLLHSRVSVCVRNRIALPPKELEWFETQVIPILPVNPSSLLDMIGVSLASLQYVYSDLSTITWLPSEVQKLQEKVNIIEAQLEIWLEGIPKSWYPRKMQSGTDLDPSIPSYRGTCNIYPSIQIANIWNTWRIYCLIIEDIKLQVVENAVLISSRSLSGWNTMPHNTIDSTWGSRKAQELINSVCLSIPFYLGNCNRATDLLSTGKSDTIYPSYHDLSPTDESYLTFRASDQYVSQLDHCRHVTLHGQVHAISILSNVIGLSARGGSWKQSHLLQEEQKTWIATQFIRSLYSMRPILGDSLLGATQPSSQNFPEAEATDMVSLAERLAVKAKQDLWTISIL
ncbi:Transcriptional regulatory protein moc3 [Fusarium austroafricanum]|uniref:Transcriptional regulatory protein moc3 n=1 Tax=Fusarium austroafricanum TaxID=2364996 RepID=A0A8H4K472_9HYPO|nr:Transcriptional regulatory protein moc3 [Fusarium austroafricanum]